MDDTFFTVLWLFILLLLTAFFEGVETAFIHVNRLGIELRKKQGKNGGIILSKLLEEPSRLIGACLLAITILTVMFCLQLHAFLQISLWLPLGITSAFAQLLLSILAATLFISIFTLYLPKPLFKVKSDPLLNFFAPIIRFFYGLLYPFTALFVNISSWVLKYVFNLRVDEKNIVFNKIDLEQFFQQGKAQDDEGQDLNNELFENALLLPNVKIRQCLVPRSTEFINNPGNAFSFL